MPLFPDAAVFFVFLGTRDFRRDPFLFPPLHLLMIFITSPLSLLLSSSSLFFLALPSLFPAFVCVLLCLLLSTTAVSSVYFNQFVVEGLGSIKPMSGVTSIAPLSHEDLEIDYEALDEQSPSVAKQGPSGQNEAAIKFKWYSEGGWHGRTLETLAFKRCS